METKICSNCKKKLSLENFVRDKYRADKLRNYCKECEAIRKKEYLAKKHDKLIIAPIEETYDANNIKILTDKEIIERMPWLEAETLASQYDKDVGFVKRGLQACRNAGTSEQYFIDRYLKEDKSVPFDRDVDYQSRIIQGLLTE